MYGPEFEKKCDEIVGRYPQPKAAMLPVLWEVQKAEGWVCLPDRYDDGGYTGGNMDRAPGGRSRGG